MLLALKNQLEAYVIQFLYSPRENGRIFLSNHTTPYPIPSITNSLRKNLSKKYELLISKDMNALNLMIFAHKQIASLVKDIQSSVVKTGYKNIVGNKGGIGINFQIMGKSFLFVDCHLTGKLPSIYLPH